MQKISRILVPVDFSQASEEAVRYACALAERHNAECTLLHILSPLEFSFALANPPFGRHEEVAALRTQAASQALERVPATLPVRRLTREGDPAEIIVATADEGGFDTIVMPTRGASAIRRWLLIGSVTAKVLSAAGCPVWTGTHFPQMHDGGLAIEHIVCAIDPNRRSEQVLCYAAMLARQFGARLTVAHAMLPAGEATEDFFDESWRMTLRSRLCDRIRQLVESVNVQAEIVIEPGKPAEVVRRAVRDARAGLVVLGRSEPNGMLDRLRADAYEIIRQASCPAVGV